MASGGGFTSPQDYPVPETMRPPDIDERRGVMERYSANVALPAEECAVRPCLREGQWGFLAVAGPDPVPVIAGREWIDRDAGVIWAQADRGAAARQIFGWWSLFLDCLMHGIILPSVRPAGLGVVPHWKLVRHQEMVRQYIGESSGVSESEVMAFLDDWADDYIRRQAPPLESRLVIGGPLGRRYLARLLRPRQPWEVNPADRAVLLRAAQAWQDEASQIMETDWAEGGATVVRISGIADGEQITLEVASGNGAGMETEEVADWALRWPPWRRALGREGTIPVHLAAQETETFWRQEVPALMALGVRLELPRHWRRPQLTVRGRLVAPDVPSTFTLNQIAEVNWEVAVDGEPVSVEELRRLVLAQGPLVKIRNRWVVADSALVQRARSLYERVRQKKVRGEEMLRLHLEAEICGISIDDGDIVRDAVSALRAPRELTLPIDGFLGTLRPYQVDGVAWLRQRMALGLGALLADDMGLGKTVEVIAALADYRTQWSGPILLICPLSVVSNWEREFRRFFPEAPVTTHLGLGRRTGAEFAKWVNRQQVILTTYDVLARDAHFLKDVVWTGVVADEAQHLKNHRTKRARALRQIRSGWRVALTGTPVENRLGDLWAEMDVLNPGYLGSEAEFRQEFERPIARNRDRAAIDRLQHLLEPFVLRRVKTDPTILPDLPDKVEIKEWTGITREQAGLYQAVVEQLWEEMNQADGHNPMARRGMILTALTQLKQVVNHPESYLGRGSALKGRSGKLDRLEELLEAILETGDRVVIFTQYVRMGGLLKPYLARKFHVPVAFFHGGLNKLERDRILAQVAEADGPRILIASLKAGGVGLNLVHAQHVIHYDRWWNPAIEDQATDRVWRIGQTKLVSVRKLIARGTLEERIDRLIESKRRISATVLMAGDSSDRWLTEMSDQEIRDLVELGDDAWIAGD